MEMAEALEHLGVSSATLGEGERDSLDSDGYVVFPDVLDRQSVDTLRRALRCRGRGAAPPIPENATRWLEPAAARTAGSSRWVPTWGVRERGPVSYTNLVNAGLEFSICYSHPRVLAAVWHVLGSFKLSSLNSRAVPPGHGYQGLHSDWSRPVGADGFRSCNSIWLLDDFTPNNGATRFVPGSHLATSRPMDVMEDAASAHPNERLVTAAAGSVIVFNAHV